MQAPTDKQNRVLQVVKDFLKENGYPPTLQEIGNRMGIKSKNAVFKHLIALERKGKIKRGRNISRGIQIVDNNNKDKYEDIFLVPGVSEEDKFIMSRASTALFDIARAFEVPPDAVGFRYGKDKEGNLIVVYTIDKV